MTGRAKKPLGHRGKKKQNAKTHTEPRLTEAQYQALLESKGQLTIFDVVAVAREKERHAELRAYDASQARSEPAAGAGPKGKAARKREISDEQALIEEQNRAWANG